MHIGGIYKHISHILVHVVKFAQHSHHLLHTNLCINVLCMDKEKDWFSSMAGRKITVIEIAKHLNVSRNTARSRLDEGLTSDEIIQLARALHLNPVTALEELGKLEGQEIFDHLDSDGTLLSTATPKQLIYHLAQDSLGYEEKGRLWKEVSDPREYQDDLAARRSGAPMSDVDDSMPLSAVAYSGPDEDAERDDAYDD